MTALRQPADGMRSGAELMVSRAPVVRWSCAIVALRLTLRNPAGPGGLAWKFRRCRAAGRFPRRPVAHHTPHQSWPAPGGLPAAVPARSPRRPQPVSAPPAGGATAQRRGTREAPRAVLPAVLRWRDRPAAADTERHRRK